MKLTVTLKDKQYSIIVDDNDTLQMLKKQLEVESNSSFIQPKSHTINRKSPSSPMTKRSFFLTIKFLSNLPSSQPIINWSWRTSESKSAGTTFFILSILGQSLFSRSFTCLETRSNLLTFNVGLWWWLWFTTVRESMKRRLCMCSAGTRCHSRECS